MFRRVLGEGAFSQAFVPVLSACKTEEGTEGARRLIDHTATLLAFALVVLCIVGVLGAPLLVWAMASGLTQTTQAYDAASLMTRVMFPYIGFMSMVALASGVLNTWRQFAVPAFTPVLLNMSLIVSMWLGGPWFARMGVEPIYSQCVGVMVGGALQLAWQVPVMRRLGVLPRIGWSLAALRAAWADPRTRTITRLMGPALLGVSVAQISLLINTQIASHLAPGSVSWISYADKLMEFPTALLGVALGVVLTPQLAAARAAKDDARYSSMLDWGLRLVVLLSVPCAVALAVFAQPLVAVLFHYGKFTELDVQHTAAALASYGAGLLGIVAIKVLAPGFYASQDMRTPMRIAIVVLIFTQILNTFLVPVLQHAALTLSISLGALLNAGWLLFGLVRRGSYKPLPGWGLFILQVVAASALLAIFLIWAGSAFPWTQPQSAWARIWTLTAILAASAAIYFGATWAAGLKVTRLLRHE